MVAVGRSRQCDGKDLSPAGHRDDDEHYVRNADYEDEDEDDGDEQDDVTTPYQNIISRQRCARLYATGKCSTSFEYVKHFMFQTF